METYFPFETEPEVEVGVDPLASNYADMIVSILSCTPDPRLLPDNEE